MPARVMVAVTALMTINSLYNTIETKLPKTTSITVRTMKNVVNVILCQPKFQLELWVEGFTQVKDLDWDQDMTISKHFSFQAIGVYMWACFFFAIASFVQTASVIYTDKLKKTIEENIKEDKEKDVDVEKQLGVSEPTSTYWNPLLTIFKFNIHMKRNKSNKKKRSRIEQIVRDPKVLRVRLCFVTLSNVHK